jgi:hypothetical protein
MTEALASKGLLTESQESKSISQAKRLLMNRLGYSDAQADEFIRIKLRNDIPVLRTPQGGKFILGVTRMFIDRDIQDAQTITDLNSTLKLVASDAHINEYDRNLNGMSAFDLIERFQSARGEMIDQDRENLSQAEYGGNSDYTIVPINSFDEARQYSQYTSWCVTHYDNMFDSYTSNGINQFYFCLKNGFENVPKQEGENCPLDEYGLSMIAVSVDVNGALNTCTCRWNHDNGGNDSIMGTKEISNVIGQNFYDVFKPNNRFKNGVEAIERQLAQGQDPRDVFWETHNDFNTGGYIVMYMDQYNWVDANNQLRSDKWYDYISRCNGFYIVRTNGRKRNVFNTNLQPVFDKWLDKLDWGIGSQIIIGLDNKVAIAEPNGHMVVNEWFEVILKFRWNYYDTEFYWVKNLTDGKKNLITQDGKYVSDIWLDVINWPEKQWVKVIANEKFNLMNIKGEYLFEQWMDYASDMTHNYVSIGMNGKYNVADNNGHIISATWFDNEIEFSRIAEINDPFIGIVTQNDGISYKLYKDGQLKRL